MKPSPRDRYLMLLYGITEADYLRILKYQGGACYICEKPPKKVKLSVDHNHKTGETRGLLCMTCNRAVAMLADSPRRAQRAAWYLDLPAAREALGHCPLGRPGRATRKWRTKRERTERTRWAENRLTFLGYIVRKEKVRCPSSTESRTLGGKSPRMPARSAVKSSPGSRTTHGKLFVSAPHPVDGGGTTER